MNIFKATFQGLVIHIWHSCSIVNGSPCSSCKIITCSCQLRNEYMVGESYSNFYFVFLVTTCISTRQLIKLSLKFIPESKDINCFSFCDRNTESFLWNSRWVNMKKQWVFSNGWWTTIICNLLGLTITIAEPKQSSPWWGRVPIR